MTVTGKLNGSHRKLNDSHWETAWQSLTHATTFTEELNDIQCEIEIQPLK